MRYFVAALALALVCSCGGGGGAAPDTSSGADPAQDPLTEEENPAFLKTRQILENCALAELEGLMDLVGLLQDTLDPGATPPELEIIGFDVLDASIDWGVDLDGDDTNDITGSIAFRDGNGDPTFPFNPLDLIGGGLDFASLLAAIQDGTRVVMSFATSRGVETTGTVAFTVEGGTPGDVSGTTVINGTNCIITLEFDSLDPDPTKGVYPIGSADATIESGEDTLEGSITFDGSSIVTVEMGLPGEPPYAFTYDLETGEMKVKND